MSNSFPVAVVDSLEHLSEAESCHLFVEWPALGNQVKEISVLRKLERDVTDLPQLQFFFKLRTLIKYESVSVRDHLDDIPMIKFREHLGLLLEIGLYLGLSVLIFLRIRLYDFERDLCTLLIALLLVPGVGG